MSKNFKVHVLGSSAAIPTSLRHTSAQLVNYHNKYFLLDCAEGTQMQLRRMRLPMMKINHIFISHLHGDHYLGLPGLLFSFHLLGRKKTLHIYAPKGMQEIIDLQYRISELTPSFAIKYHVVEKARQPLYDDNDLTIESIEMWHRLPAYGFLIKEKAALKNIDKKALDKYDIPISAFNKIKKGEDLVLPNGERVPNTQLTLPPAPGRSYAFCSDTGFTDQYVEQIMHADLLYHEATFLNDKEEIAREKTHCTARQAAEIAKMAKVKKLMLGHYSARYDDTDPFREEASQVFENSIVAIEGMCVDINQAESAEKPAS